MEDLTGLGKAAEKLIEEISKGIGTVYRPRAIRKEAEARAYEIRLVGKVATESEAESIRQMGLAEAERKLMLADIEQEILDRAKARLVRREVQRQLNIEKISAEALKALPESVSSAPVSDDWRSRFFSIAEDVSDEDMQKIWGKVLAGEVAQPGSYSLRALEVLRNLNKAEAEAFQRACNLAFQDGTIIKLEGSNHLRDFGLPYDEMLVLRAAGLLHDSDTLNITYDASRLPSGSEKTAGGPNAGKFMVSINNGIFVKISGDASVNFKFQILALTPVGNELMRLVDPKPNIPYLRQLVQDLGQKKYLVKKVGSVGSAINVGEVEDF